MASSKKRRKSPRPVCSRCQKRPRRAKNQRYCLACAAEANRGYRSQQRRRLEALKAELAALQQHLSRTPTLEESYEAVQA